MASIVFLENTFKKFEETLFQPAPEEGMCILFTGLMSTDTGPNFLVKYMLPVDAQDLDVQSHSYLQLKSDVYQRVLTFADRTGLNLVVCHTHPFAEDQVEFSSIDTASDLENGRYIQDKIPEIRAASLVRSRKSARARYYDPRTNDLVDIEEIKVVGPQKGVRRVPSSRMLVQPSVLPSERLHRNILAFGREGQQRLQCLRVAIIGASGLGNPLLIQLVQLGVENFILIDPEEIEWVNLNRLSGVGPPDVGQKKVSVHKRLVQEMRPEARVQAVPLSVFNEEGVEHLKQADVLFGCADSEAVRYFLTHLAALYLIPYFDLGSGILTDGEGEVTYVGGQVRVFIPGETPCLECLQGLDKRRLAYEIMSEEDRGRERQRGYVQGFDLSNPSVGCLNSTVAGLAAGECMAWITGLHPLHPYVQYDQMAKKIHVIEAGRDPDCILCSHQARLGMGDTMAMLEMSLRRTSRPPLAYLT